jgi:hypothetical protein
MRRFALVSIPAAALLIASCSSSSSGPAPAAAPAPATAAAGRGGAAAPGGGAATQAAGRGGAGGAAAAGAAQPGAAGAPAGGRGGQPQLTLEQRQARVDSITAARQVYVKEVMASIAGKENEPAEKVFKNVQLMKTVTAGQLVAAMDQGIGRGTGKGCNDCHVTTDWASDTLARKKTARTMLGIVNSINTNELPKMGPGRGGQPRAISCITCHRGGQAGRQVIIP